MIKKTSTIVIFFILALALYGAYIQLILPEGVTPMSGNSETLAWLALGSAGLSFLTSLVGLIQKIIERRKRDS